MRAQPTVTLIVLNYNGLEHLPDCFNSLQKLDYPKGQLELMMVDNASGDGSVQYVRSDHPHVRIVQSSENLGFAGGNNLGAREATGEYVVFLNNDMVVDPGLVDGLVETLLSDPEAVSAGAKILNWDGTQFDFVGGTANFAGRGAQRGLGEPYEEGRYNEIVPSLFACGGAMVIDRQVFLDIGGFDDDYFMFYEDVDLGWRLWIQGYKVLFAPDAVTYHRHHGTTGRFANHRKEVLYHRNALCTVLKNYSDENLPRVLPAVLLAQAAGVVEEAVDARQLDLESFSLMSQKRTGSGKVALEKANLSSLIALQQIANELPRWMEKRRLVQEGRKRTDDEIAHLFRPYHPAVPWKWSNTAYSVTRALGAQELFADAPRRILVVSPDLLPYAGLPTVGSALRAWALGQGLQAAGHEVLFTMPRMAIDRFEGVADDEVLRLAYETGRVGDVIATVRPDMVLACGWSVLFHLLHKPNVPVILDQHGPHMLELHYQELGAEGGNAAEKLRALRIADYFTCPGERQLAYFRGWLERAGWSEEERGERSMAVPLSLSPEQPPHRPEGELKFVYGGVFLPWQDPSLGLTTLVSELERRGRGRLHVFGGRHPVHEIAGGVMEELVKRLDESPRVVREGMVSHGELLEAYSRSHVAIDLMRRNPERDLAITTRTIEYLWCGLPVIYNDYAELADHIREYEAGWTVDPDDPEAIREVIADIIEHPEQLPQRSLNAKRLVHDRFRWDQTIAPIDQVVRFPSVRRIPSTGDLVSVLLPSEVTLLVQRLRAKLPPSLDRRVRAVLGAVVKTPTAGVDDSPIPIEMAVFAHRVVLGVSRLVSWRVVPLPVARAGRRLLRRAIKA